MPRSDEITLRVWCLVGALTVLLSLGRIAIAQDATPAFWSLRPEQVDPMLLQVPDGDDHRYAKLHEYFSDLHCTSNLMKEHSIPKHVRKNLLCVLPGKETDQIVVAARYDRREQSGEGWSEAVMLPMLYNALQAQPRQHTFVFAAIYGRAGEDEFFHSLGQNGQMPARAIVVLDSLGRSAPRFYTAPVGWLSTRREERTATNKLLESEAARTAHLQKIPPYPPASVENSLQFKANKIPSILVYSDFQPRVSAPAFREEFDFVAYFLCRIDNKLVSLPPSSQKAR
jgi:hypothetical protein